MARAADRLDANAPGDVYVDASCIDCGACRWMAPEVFDAHGDHSRVHTQPRDDDALDRALAAVVACPTGSIGTEHRHDMARVVRSFPRAVTDGVDHCGFHSRDSFGAASWLIRRPGGNVLVDSPRFSAPLANALEARGGARWMFLTHRDDVADHAKWAERLGCTRVLHADDLTRGTMDVEQQITGVQPVALAEDLLVLPTPGHTRGSACLLHRDVLFTGDSLAGVAGTDRLTAFRRACWYDWDVLRESLSRLQAYRFAWVLPGHGAPLHLPADAMRARLEALLAGM